MSENEVNENVNAESEVVNSVNDSVYEFVAMSAGDIADRWSELTAIVHEIEPDLAKNLKGVDAAGARIRKRLRDLKKRCTELSKVILLRDKSLRGTRVTSRGKRKVIVKL